MSLEQDYLISDVNEGACRMCLEEQPKADLIRPCACSGSLRFVHRECLDKWRAVSPHPDAMVACELCKSKFKLIETPEGCGGSCWRYTRYTFAIALDLTFFFGILFGLYLLSGFLGDLSFNTLVADVICHHYNQTVTDPSKECPGAIMPFLWENLWQGRIWFWGFVVFFFVLGVIGCGFWCCCGGDSGGHYVSDRDHYSRGDCWWVCCGPTYYNGVYYGSPFGYWGPGDMCCWWCITDYNYHHYHYHHHYHNSGCAGGGCSGGDCGGCGGCGGCSSSDCDKDGAAIILVIVAIIVAIFVIIGVLFGSVLAFLMVNKITKRHLEILQKKSDAKKLVVANLDDPSQLGMASAEFDYDEAIHTHKKEQEMVRGEEEDEIKKEKKGYDTY